MNQIVVHIQPTQETLEIMPGESLLQALLGRGYRIRSLCKGVPSCAECRITVKEGLENLLPPSAEEVRLIGNSYRIDGKRLACQCRPFGPVTISIEDHLKSLPESMIRGRKGKQTDAVHAKIKTLALNSEGEN